MRKFVRRAVILAALAPTIVGCAQQGTEGAKLAAGEKLHITKEVWADYQEYVQEGRALGPDRQGAFGVALVGDVGVAGLYSYRYCRANMAAAARADRTRPAGFSMPAAGRMSSA